MKNKIINCWIVIVIITIILWGIFFIYSILNSNIWRKIKCPTYPIDYEYVWTIKAEYKGLILIDWTYSHIDWNKVYDWCYRDAWLEDNSLVCPEWYNSWARIEETWEWVLDREEDHCYYVDDDESMLKAIYDERHRED